MRLAITKDFTVRDRKHINKPLVSREVSSNEPEIDIAGLHTRKPVSSVYLFGVFDIQTRINPLT